MSSQTPLFAVILAAGQSKRFGSDKRLALSHPGQTMLQATVAALHGQVDTIYVAIRAGDTLQQSSGIPVNWHISTRAAQGMGCTLADMVAGLPPQCNVLVALADMPFIKKETIAQLVQHFRQSRKQAPIVFPQLMQADASTTKGVRGHPVIFSHHFRQQLQELRGDRGANSIIQDNPQAQDPLLVDDSGVIRDIDRPEDLLLRNPLD